MVIKEISSIKAPEYTGSSFAHLGKNTKKKCCKKYKKKGKDHCKNCPIQA